ncbi:hypothetical protein CAPTEDRAFT_219830 [Capitella teleta]|uniref:Uncharacterized protein n=1 Tax=Capitella teleta TaxID=283909 RepID=R7VIW6_CAPTE|nr:hypothetical protein CAPTEDRAFT_219830 [Capitella teleta]|eukprot:ELU18497.1 hypothetical protein CAPTEDRAFT_219830 [Capitella teleta]
MESDSSYGTDPYHPKSPTAMMSDPYSGQGVGSGDPYDSRMGSTSDNEAYATPDAQHQADLRSMSEMLKNRSQEDISKKSKKSRMPKAPSFDVRGSFRKMKGAFKRGKDKQSIQQAASSHSIEVQEHDMEPQMLNLAMAGYPGEDSPASGYATPQPYDHHPGGYDVNPTDTLPRKQSGNKFDTMKSSVKNWLYPTIPNDPPNRPSEIAVLNKAPEKSLVRMSNAIYLLLIVGAVVGLVLLCMSSEGEHFSVLGALLFGLSLLALVGKVFLTIFWSEDPCPRLQPYLTKIDDVIGGAKDPYRLTESTVQAMPQVQPANAFSMDEYTYRYSMPPEGGLPSYDMPDVNPQYGDFEYPAPAYNGGYEPDAPAGYYGEKPPMTMDEETIDTKMRAGRSVEAIADQYDKAEFEGNDGPAVYSNYT